MSQEVTSILVLAAIFAIGTLRPINMGLLGITAAFVVGSAVGVSEEDIFAGFPGDLFIILVGVTYLFAIATNNGTVDWLVHAAVKAVGGGPAAIPGVVFGVPPVAPARDPVGDFRRHRRAHRVRRGGAGSGGHHRPDRARVRDPVRHQPRADGP